MCFDNDDYVADFGRDELRQARKPHQCEACRKVIAVGQLCRYSVVRFEGDFSALYMCGACVLTEYRIHLHEMQEGCGWSESWCPMDELASHCRDTGLEFASPQEGQKFLAWRRESHRLRKANRKLVLAGEPTNG